MNNNNNNLNKNINKNTNNTKKHDKNKDNCDKPIIDLSENKTKSEKQETKLTIFNKNHVFLNLHDCSKNIFDDDEDVEYVINPLFLLHNGINNENENKDDGENKNKDDDENTDFAEMLKNIRFSNDFFNNIKYSNGELNFKNDLNKFSNYLLLKNIMHKNNHSNNLKLYNDYDDKCKYIYTIISSLHNKQKEVTSDILMLKVNHNINNFYKNLNSSKKNSKDIETLIDDINKKYYHTFDKTIFNESTVYKNSTSKNEVYQNKKLQNSIVSKPFNSNKKRNHITWTNNFKFGSNKINNISDNNSNNTFNWQKAWNSNTFSGGVENNVIHKPPFKFNSKYDMMNKRNSILKQPNIKKERININVEINNIDDILKLIDDYPLKYDIQYNINMQALHNIKEPLEDLHSMIGMQTIKETIIDQILYFVQEFHNSNSNDDFMHTVIYGPPGTGKTEVAKIIGRLFSKLGVLKNNVFKKVTRADLIAGYLGQTAIKTKEVVNSAIGGVLFIDEAYALGNKEKRDIFAKECIDTLCEALSDNKDKLMVIIAGYEDELKNCFFEYNKGLDSRFPWRYKTDDYKAPELKEIFVRKISKIDWDKKEIPDSWFEDKMDYFKFYGRDMETLLAKVKIAHSRRVFCLSNKEKKIITIKDMDKGFQMFISNDEVKKRLKQDDGILKTMYM